MTDIRGRCPACFAQPLTLARDGIVACSAPGCRDRGAANYLLHGGDMALASLLGGDARARIMAESLAVDGITYAKLASVTDAELDRVPGINSTAIARIREVFAAPSAGECRPVEAMRATKAGLGCPCHMDDERCSACRRCPDICTGCDVALLDLAREHPEEL